MQEEVSNLKKAKTSYIQRHQEWERCRDAARIAEQGAELGATGDNKVSCLSLGISEQIRRYHRAVID